MINYFFVFFQYFYIVLCEKLYEIPVGVGTENGSEILYENKFLFRPRVRQVINKYEYISNIK